MNDEIKNLLNEMEKVVMELHRSAGNLDDCITGLEHLLSEEYDKDSTRYLIQMHRRMRAEHDRIRHYHTLIDKENDIWNRLLEASK